MLTRAARRRQIFRHLQHVADNLQLPFLCPVLLQSRSHRRQHTSVTRRSSKSVVSQTGLPSTQCRKLASAAPSPDLFDHDDDFSHFNLYNHFDVPFGQRRDPQISSLPPWDPSTFIHIESTTLARPPQMNTNQIRDNEIRGNSIEVERNLEACLHLRKWPRAFANLRQLATLFPEDVTRMRYYYNKTLANMVDDLVESRNSENEGIILQWIEKDMKHAGLEPDAYTFALVIKAALNSSARSKRERTVRRYWDMAKGYELQAQVGSLRDILTDRDLGYISEICPLEASLRPFEQPLLDDSEVILAEDVVARKRTINIQEMEQKGLGLTSLRQTLALFSDVQDQDRMLSESSAEQSRVHALERQQRLEQDAIDSAIGRWKSEHEKMAKMGITSSLSQGAIGALMWQWHEILSAKISKELEMIKAAENSNRKSPQDRLRIEYGPYLQYVAHDKLAAITAISLVQIMNKVGTSKSVKLVRLVTELGKVIEAEVRAERLSNRQRKASGQYSDTAAAIIEPALRRTSDVAVVPAKPSKSLFYRPAAKGSLPHHATRPSVTHPDWPVAIQAKVGAILCELMFDTAKIKVRRKESASDKNITAVQPIFMRQTVYSNGRRVGVVSLHEDFVKILAREPPGDVIAKQLPMVCTPRPWTGFNEGGYLATDQPVLRVKNSESLQKDYAVAATQRGDLDQLFAGLDILGATGWKINQAVFEVMIEAWNTGEAIANLPPLAKDVPLPIRPDSSASSKEKWEWFSKVRAIDNERSGHHSNRCFQNFQMEIAKAYLGETFYLPHNIDFRGRAYPIPPYLNQMGADNCRGLMVFAKGRPLGHDGLQWLKIHLSNVYGYDKASLSDRAQFPIDHIQQIRDSVFRPLSGSRWWLTAEDPWQCLAACHELVNALDSTDPASYVSHLPVHQDGSCNGLQHYAALGGDIAGAKQVNLEPGDKPADVYTGVCELVKAEVAHDAQAGDELAQLLDGKITRKVVKQTVMTNVYGVTFLGAIRQVRKQVDALIPELTQRQKSGKAATYIAKKIFRALGSLFTGAHEIQYWLGDCANRISSSISPAQLDLIAQKQKAPTATVVPKVGRRPQRRSKARETLDPTSFRTSVIWTTPLKLPVVQPYRVNKSASIQTNLQRINLYEPSVADAVDKRKQLQAFPPNFIHSLDATHMLLSALKANELGLSFSAVHDSFWTHAADVNTLNVLLREAFIRMHSEDIVGRLAAEFKMRYHNHLYMAQVSKMSPLGRALQAYRADMADKGELPRGNGSKAIKERKHAELLREIERRRYLASKDPLERLKGADMVTAASLFEKFDGERYISSRDSLGETAIGSVPHETSEARIEEALKSDDVNGDVDLEGTLEPLVEQTSQKDAAEAEEAAPAPKKRTNGPPKNLNNSTWLWLPLSFRQMPKKGDFDVNRLRQSQYFFS